MKPNCHKKYFHPGPCLRLHPCRMWHSFVRTLSNRMNRITLLMYVITIRNTSPPTISTVMRAPKIAGSMFGKFPSMKWRDDPELCELKFVGKLKLPPEPISPASRPTSASFDHCQKRNGCTSCRLVC